MCLLNCGPTGAECVKNLVLGGIASFTLVDDAVVEARDLGNNFFVTSADLGRGRAEAVAAHLNELNASVAGAFVDERPEEVIATNPAFFADFTVVIAAQMPARALVALDTACRERNVALVVLHSRGLAGFVRLSLASHRVVEAKPEETDHDLRLTAPWPELEAFAASFDLDAADDAQFRHVPWAALLLRALAARKKTAAAADGASGSEEVLEVMKTREEQRAFKASLLATRRRGDEENFAEAAANARHAWKPPAPPLPLGLRAALADLERAGGDPAAMCRGGSGAEGLESGGVAVAGGGSSVAPALRRSAAKKEAEEAKFWHLLAGLRGFLDASGGALPLEGSVPDMTSTTESFVALQKIYRAKADLDAARVAALANASARRGAETAAAAAAAPEGLVSEEEARFFCKHAAHVRVMRWRTLAEERDWDAGAREETAKALAAEDTRRCASLYVIHRAADAFLEEAGRFPGAGAFSSREGAGAGAGGDKDPSSPSSDAARLKALVDGALAELGVPPGLDAMDDLVAECARGGGGEMHAVAAVVGGVGSQEVIKLVTGQFVPVAKTLVYDAAEGTTACV